MFTLLLTAKVYSQPKQTFWLHANGGINSSWIVNQNVYGNPEFEYATTFKLSGGGGVNYFINDKVGLGADFYTTRMGQNYAGEQRGARAVRKVKFAAYEVPIYAMIRLKDKEDLEWFTIGPDLWFITSANQEYTRKGGRPLQNQEGMKEGDVIDRFNTFDVALNVGINKMIKLNYKGNFLLLLSANTAMGILDINKDGWKTPNLHGIYGSSHNYYIGIKAGLMFNLFRTGGGGW